MIKPAVHFGVSGAGLAAWFGWPDGPAGGRPGILKFTAPVFWNVKIA